MLLLAVALGCWLAGCRVTNTTPRVIYLEGSSWFGTAGKVKAGLRAGGYRGAFETFTWTSFLGWGADHLVASRSPAKARKLARRIEELRRRNPEGRIHLIGLSAGTSLLVRALERLPDDVLVDHVVLFSCSRSADGDLTAALEHVKGRLYATCSRRDAILGTMAVTADGRMTAPAGRRGFVLPDDLTDQAASQYAKVVNLPWKAAYLRYGWNGGHLRVTEPRFVRSVIAPRILSAEPFPLDRPLSPGEADSADAGRIP